MENFLFYLFAALTIGGGLMLVLSRNTVNGAMYMILAFISTAGLFLLLEAYFLAVLQILVYAGAVMVLFLFIIMLLNVEGQAKKMPAYMTILASTIGLLLLSLGVYFLFWAGGETQAVQTIPVEAMPDLQSSPFAFTTSSKSFGYGLFTKYMLPVQVTGFLLLVSMIGVVVISKKMNNSQAN